MVIPSNATYQQKYGPAMQLQSEAEAAEYFEACVTHCMRHGHSREEAERIERMNLGYYAGYYDDDTRRRVERLFRCAHPVFGSIEQKGPPTPEQALAAGKAMANTEAE